MTGKVKAIPDGYRGAIPYLIVHDGAAALDFYRRAFDAQELMRLEHAGRVGHAEFRIGDALVMLADEHPQMGARSPRQIGGSPVSILVYVEDVDALFAKALAAGATLQHAVEDKFYGDRSGSVEDPFGHTWHFATHVEDVPPEEMDRRAKAMMAQG